jgi:hypothetical protein
MNCCSSWEFEHRPGQALDDLLVSTDHVSQHG